MRIGKAAEPPAAGTGRDQQVMYYVTTVPHAVRILEEGFKPEIVARPDVAQRKWGTPFGIQLARDLATGLVFLPASLESVDSSLVGEILAIGNPDPSRSPSSA